MSNLEVEIGGRISGGRLGIGSLFLMGAVQVNASHFRNRKMNCPVCGVTGMCHGYYECK